MGDLHKFTGRSDSRRAPVPPHVIDLATREPRLMRFLARLDKEQRQIVEIIAAAIIRGAL